jgi:hypothetical protein
VREIGEAEEAWQRSRAICEEGGLRTQRSSTQVNGSRMQRSEGCRRARGSSTISRKDRKDIEEVVEVEEMVDEIVEVEGIVGVTKLRGKALQNRQLRASGRIALTFAEISASALPSHRVPHHRRSQLPSLPVSAESLT